MVRALIKTSSEQGLTQVNLTYRTATTATGTPGVGVFHSTILNRAPTVDLSNDLLPRMGVERIEIQSIQEVSGEFAPNGERVFKFINDRFDQVRFVGRWINLNDASGPRPYGQSTGDYIEVSFYGTGLNILHFMDTGARTYDVFVDGAAATGLTITGSSVLNGRNYSTNHVVPVVSGLALGYHTVRVVANAVPQFVLYGIEILNESTSIKTAAGTSAVNGKLITLAALNTQAYNSTFDSGTLGTRGGRVLVYQKTDGSIGKSVTPTNASSATLTSTDHTNEEVIRNYYWREFGAGRTDDFSTLTTVASSRAFTLDDGTTTLLADSVDWTNVAARHGIRNATNGNFITITFVGTGLDIKVHNDNFGVDSHTVSIDGGAPVVFQGTTPSGYQGTRIIKIVSGLPYGTHTVKFARVTAANYNIYYENFIIYGPKKPTLPSGAIELADYNIMANYVSASSAAVNNISQGVLRKMGTRENTYTGTWLVGGLTVALFNSGWNINNVTSGGVVSYRFFGTGIEYSNHINNTQVYNISVTVDGSALNAGSNVGSTVSFQTNGPTGLSMSAAGVITGTAVGDGRAAVRVSGLSLGSHIITVTINNNTGTIYGDIFDVVTPIHVHKNNGPFIVQNTLAVGSSGINDGRALSAPLDNYLIRNCGVAENGAGGGTYTAEKFPGSTSNTINIRPGKRLRVDVMIHLVPINAGDNGGYGIYLDGVRVSYKEATMARAYTGGGSTAMQVAQSETFNVAPGVHHVYIKLIQGGTVSDEGHRIYVTEVD